MNQLKNTSRGLLTLVLLATITGCASTTPTLDDNFGLAVQAARAQQTVNPEASRTAAAMTGHDANAAVSAIKQYQQSFEKPAESAGTTINIGGGGGTR